MLAVSLSVARDKGKASEGTMVQNLKRQDLRVVHSLLKFCTLHRSLASLYSGLALCDHLKITIFISLPVFSSLKPIHVHALILFSQSLERPM